MSACSSQSVRFTHLSYKTINYESVTRIASALTSQSGRIRRIHLRKPKGFHYLQAVRYPYQLAAFDGTAGWAQKSAN
jgi:hypothetical protein